MKATMFLAYWLQTALALICVPFLHISGFRFGKKWRGNWIVHHVAANIWADGYKVAHPKFLNRYI